MISHMLQSPSSWSLPVGRQEQATALAGGTIVVSFFVIRNSFRHPKMVERLTWKKLRIFLEI